MIKAIIFDCFGVITIDGWLKFCDEYIHDPEKTRQAHNLNHITDKGQLPYKDFLVAMENLTGVAAKEIDEKIYERLPKNDRLLSYIKHELKGKYKTAVLSNISNPRWFGEYFSQDEMGLFDEFVISTEEGIIKPDPEIFLIAARRLGVEAQESVFIDDRPNNVAAAEAVGMKGLLYQNLPKLKTDLEKLLAGADK